MLGRADHLARQRACPEEQSIAVRSTAACRSLPQLLLVVAYCYCGTATAALLSISSLPLVKPLRFAAARARRRSPLTVRSNMQVRRAGAAGPILPGVEMKLEHSSERDADGEGEICVRGRHVMMERSERLWRESLSTLLVLCRSQRSGWASYGSN